ncbi:response regulator [Bremerella cremea]|uniref:response regulator n=1 Tax=Bremerella cremea TaxID=1031537 RepID=UPI0031F13D59
MDYEMGTMAVRMDHPEVQILRAKNCREGRALIEKYLPSLIFLDLNLANCNGFEVLQTLKEQVPDILPCVVVFSTSSNPGDRVQALALGASDFHSKSADPDQYLMTVRQLTASFLK